jgi:hypothetical protein
MESVGQGGVVAGVADEDLAMAPPSGLRAPCLPKVWKRLQRVKASKSDTELFSLSEFLGVSRSEHGPSWER